MDYIIMKPELRPCIVRTRGEEKQAIFHRWEQRIGACGPLEEGGTPCESTSAECFGIVELEDGRIIRRYPGQITFVDGMVGRVWDETATTVAEGAEHV